MSEGSKFGPQGPSSDSLQEATEYEGNDPLVGSLIGKYQVRERVARGGTATVYKAFDTVLKRDVAFKILHQHLESRSEVVERFRVEAQTVASLRHPNILNVIDFFNYEGRSVLVAEFMPGITLSHLIRDLRRIPENFVLMLGAEILRGLKEAHARGFTHRDIKPANILLHPELGVKISDFGLAKLVNADDGLTKEGVFVGTPSFSSPEQIEGKKVDHRTDIFSLGLCLYMMATGRHAFKQKGDSTTTVWFKIVRGKFQGIREIDFGLSQDLEKILSKALQVDREKRYSSANDMLQDVMALLKKRGEGEYADNLKKYLVEPFAAEAEKKAAVKRYAKQALILSSVAVLVLAAFVLAWDEAWFARQFETESPSTEMTRSDASDLEQRSGSPEEELESQAQRSQAPGGSSAGVGAKGLAVLEISRSSQLVYESGDESYALRFRWAGARGPFSLMDIERGRSLVSGQFEDRIFDWDAWLSGEFEWQSPEASGNLRILSWDEFRDENPVTKRDIPVSSNFAEVEIQLNPWNQQLRLTWEAGPGADSYRVEVAEDEHFQSIIFSGVVPQRFVQVDRLWDENTQVFWRVQYLDAARNVFYIQPVRQLNLSVRLSSNHFDILEPRAFQRLESPVFIRAVSPAQSEVYCGDQSIDASNWPRLERRLGFLEGRVPVTGNRVVCLLRGSERDEYFSLPLRIF